MKKTDLAKFEKALLDIVRATEAVKCSFDDFIAGLELIEEGIRERRQQARGGDAMPRGHQWRMIHPCSDCPLSESAAGLHLRRSLHPGRVAEIKRSLRQGKTFMCHKTTDETGNGSNLLCAGGLDYCESVGASSNYQRVCQTLDWLREQRKP